VGSLNKKTQKINFKNKGKWSKKKIIGTYFTFITVKF
jgi:hypothetical protein